LEESFGNNSTSKVEGIGNYHPSHEFNMVYLVKESGSNRAEEPKHFTNP
jgi:hypothetical protein